MQVQVLVTALLVSSAAIAFSHKSPEDVSTSRGQSSATTAPVAGASDDSLNFGLSGKLRGPLVSYLTKQPFSAKVNGRIGQYLMGFWPGERGRVTKGAYSNPEGFVEVTPDNQNTPVSKHFRLRDFLTHDQAPTW